MQDLFKQLSRPHVILPGIATAFVIALGSRQLASLPGLKILGPMIIAILIGVLLRVIIGLPAPLKPGTVFSSRWLLRGAIMLMGARLHFGKVMQLGPYVLLLDAVVVFAALALFAGLGRIFKLPPRLTTLIAAGTGICGAAAVAATAPVVEATEEETALAIAVIASLGTLGTIIYSYIYNAMSLSPAFYGTWVGSTLHEVAHVVAAAAVAGGEASDLAVLVKLGRVAMLAPAVLFIGLRQSRKGRNNAKVAFPLFVVGFLIISILTTQGIIPPAQVPGLTSLSAFVLTIAMAAIGMGVDVKAFARVGFKPFAVGLIGSVFISLVSIMIIRVL
ncbi:MAG: hypothetical protein FD169_1897 [Bacillota bacterium]|nr:MAG: hypothetical protein FD169_1897 [Bacillota bacterium]